MSPASPSVLKVGFVFDRYFTVKTHTNQNILRKTFKEGATTRASVRHTNHVDGKISDYQHAVHRDRESLDLELMCYYIFTIPTAPSVGRSLQVHSQRA